LALGLLLTLKGALLVATAWNARLVMDELALLQWVFQAEFAQFYRTVDPIKTVLGLLMWMPPLLAETSVAAVRIARVIGLLLAASSLALIALVARRVSRLRAAAPLAVLGALAFSNFAEQSFRVRTDTVALPLALGALLLLLRDSPSRNRLLAAGALLGLAFLCTQKSIYFAVAIGLGALASEWARSGARRALLGAAWLASGFWVAFLAYAWWFGGQDALEVIRQVLAGPQFVSAGSAEFAGFHRYVEQTLVRNVVPYGVCGAGLGWALLRWRQVAAAVRLTSVTTLLVVALTFLHDQTWPYVFVWPQAFLALWVAPLGERIGLRAAEAGRQAIAALLVLFAFSVPRNVAYFRHDNAAQLAAIAGAERLLAPEDRYFDGIGMLVKRRIAGPYPDWWWDKPALARLRVAHRRGDDRVARQILADQPKLWILNYRFETVQKMVEAMTRGGFVRVDPILLLAGVELPAAAGETTFLCRWEGDYALFDETGRRVAEAVAVDGATATAAPRVGLGLHRISREGPVARRFLLPADALLSGPIPVSGTVPALFGEIYDF